MTLSSRGFGLIRFTAVIVASKLFRKAMRACKERDELYWTVRKLMEESGDSEDDATVNVHLAHAGVEAEDPRYLRSDVGSAL